MKLRKSIESLRQQVDDQQSILSSLQSQSQLQLSSSSSTTTSTTPNQPNETKENKEIEKINQFLQQFHSTLHFDVMIVNAEQYAIIVQKRNQTIARVEVRFLPFKKAEMTVTIHPSIPYIQTKQMESILPVRQSWVVDVKDMKESIYRICWIITQIVY